MQLTKETKPNSTQDSSQMSPFKKERERENLQTDINKLVFLL